MRPRGELSRHRTIIEEVGDENDADAKNANPDASARRAVDTVDLPAGPRRSRARPDLDGPWRRRPDLFLPRAPAAQDAGDRGTERRHGRRPCLVPAGLVRRLGRADREGRSAARLDHPRLSPSSAHHRGQCRPGAHRLGPGRARAEARADRPLPRFGRDGGRAAGDRPQQGRPGRPGRMPVGDRPVCSARLRNACHVGRRWPRPRPPARIARRAA